jgi:hypothetical protein
MHSEKIFEGYSDRSVQFVGEKRSEAGQYAAWVCVEEITL